ncbi:MULTISPECIES: hypothetical protein [Bacteroides]|mgnify:FL=1|jgi:hypothetical protein|uniref:Uncharacterized protein n=1 Tax=Bacteroides oleiciplenus TaxID=626931 RepID=A0A3E5BAE1_9BACE|nr:MULTISPECIES: hypothetical protein [Bacteroides]MCE8464016.1 hypothetical protein [Bacteroides nordii]RGN34592.1 hypothetical protein DXB65_12755 [Bacteroides oleiciplenus]UYU49470.1 hypothetical protein KQP55_02350 [Bacteroides nordii]
MFQDIFKQLDKIVANGGGFSEVWGNLTINIDYYTQLQEDVQNLYRYLEAYNQLLIPQVSIDSNFIDIDEIEDYSGSHFIIVINKTNLKLIEDYSIQFFYCLDYFEDWLKNVSPFTKLPYTKLKIFVNELTTSCGGTNLLITGDYDESFDSQIDSLPSDSLISNHVLLPNGRNLSHNVHEYLITFINKRKSKPQTKYYNFALIYSCATLCGTFVNELDGATVVIQGIKRIKIPLFNDNTIVDLKLSLLLKDIVEWIYQDRDDAKIDIRRKLFLDRITLDIDYEQPLLSGLPLIAQNAFEQAKERYSFVMLERRDAYAKELAILLKDLKQQSELYSAKLRTFLSNLTRDVLAGILLVGFTLFTKFTEIEVLSKHEKLINIIFKGLAVYFIASALMQMITDISDVLLSKKELNHWSKCTSETIPKKELDGHIKKTLNPRLWTTSIIYILLLFIYGVIALIAWNFPAIWNKILN